MNKKNIIKISIILGCIIVSILIWYLVFFKNKSLQDITLFKKNDEIENLQSNNNINKDINLGTGQVNKMIPLIDMGASDSYYGEDGGLYGGGSNVPPSGHLAAAKKEIAKIQPLDTAGRPSTSGKIGVISVGMSNTKMKFTNFLRQTSLAYGARRGVQRVAGTNGVDSQYLSMVNLNSDINPALVLINGAQSGQDANAWLEREVVWKNLEAYVEGSGLSKNQVQVVWLLQANAQPSGTFPADANLLKENMKAIIQRLKQEYPNIRVVYLSSRTYAGYATTTLNPEPYAYEYGFAVRGLIQEQINGASELYFDEDKGGEVKAPLLLWGPYLWANGEQPRSDGLFYVKSDYSPDDGTHPATPGAQEKVVALLDNFFKTSELAAPWFLGCYSNCILPTPPVTINNSGPLDSEIPPALNNNDKADKGEVNFTKSNRCRVSNGFCEDFTVSCQDVVKQGTLIVNEPTGAPKGTIFLMTGGGGGQPFHLTSNQQAASMAELIAQGYRAVELAWSNADEGIIGYPTPVGAVNLFCAPTAVMQAFQDEFGVSGPFCAQGNSGGSMQIAYGLTFYNLGNLMDVAILSGGPPTSSFTEGCNGLPRGPYGFAPDKGLGPHFIDGISGYGYDAPASQQYCNQAWNQEINIYDYPDIVAKFDAQSLAVGHGLLPNPNGTYNYPQTKVYFVESKDDASNANNIGQLYYNLISAADKSFTEVSSGGVSNGGHNVPETPEGATKINSLLLSQCK